MHGCVVPSRLESLKKEVIVLSQDEKAAHGVNVHIG